jgi:hypothetical protein
MSENIQTTEALIYDRVLTAEEKNLVYKAVAWGSRMSDKLEAENAALKAEVERLKNFKCKQCLIEQRMPELARLAAEAFVDEPLEQCEAEVESIAQIILKKWGVK